MSLQSSISYSNGGTKPRPRVKPTGCCAWTLLTDCTGTLYRDHPDWAVPAAQKDGWVVIADSLTEAEAKQYRADLYAGRITVEEIIEGVA